MDRKTSDWTTPNLGAEGCLTLPFAAVMDQAPIEVVISDARGQIQFINRRFEAFLGLPKEEAVGQPIEVLKQPSGNRQFYDMLRRSMDTGTPRQGKLACPTSPGEARIYDITISPIREKEGNQVVFLSVLRDITDLDTREKQLQQAGKMEAIGTLAGGIAHDFNNILAGMVGYAELVKEDLDALEGVSPKTHARLDNMILGAMRAKRLIQQILTFSRSERQVCSRMAANPMVKEVVQLLRASLPSTIRIELALETEALVMAEPTQIHQILMNLCTNARDAMRDSGGVLSISLTEVKTKSNQGGMREWVLLRVADTGPGIARDLKPKVMEPFFTTKPVEKGTGMGLSVVHGIVSDLNGKIEIKENSPSGSVFDIFLPLHRKAAQAAGKAAEPRPPARGRGECVLFVDDESDLVSIAEDGLSSMGYRVVGFDDSPKALDWFRDNAAVPDLLISDVTMPGVPGDLLTREVLKLRPDLPVLLITGASERVDQARLEEVGAMALLHKPMVMDQMAAVIRQALDRGENG